MACEQNTTRENNLAGLKRITSYGLFAIDITLGGLIPLDRPIGISKELRYQTRLWRIRVGHTLHAALLINGIAYQDYTMILINVAFLAGGIASVGGRPFSPRRLKRMYTPFLDNTTQRQNN